MPGKQVEPPSGFWLYKDQGWLVMLDIYGLLTAVGIVIMTLIFHFAVSLDPLYVPENDSLSNFPYPGKSTISATVCWIAVAVIDAVVLIAAYLLSFWRPHLFHRFNFFTAVWCALSTVLMVTFVTEWLKSVVGRPRPDIYARCGPNSNYSVCDKVIGKDSKDEFKSWPSGHSSVSMSGTLFAVLFCQKLIWTRQVWSQILPLLLLLFPFYVGATRIRDFRHHPDDVIAGFFIGFVFTIVIWRRVYKRIFWRERASNDEIHALERNR
jgi:phosphatidate phosphatase